MVVCVIRKKLTIYKVRFTIGEVTIWDLSFYRCDWKKIDDLRGTIDDWESFYLKLTIWDQEKIDDLRGTIYDWGSFYLKLTIWDQEKIDDLRGTSYDWGSFYLRFKRTAYLLKTSWWFFAKRRHKHDWFIHIGGKLSVFLIS